MSDSDSDSDSVDEYMRNLVASGRMSVNGNYSPPESSGIDPQDMLDTPRREPHRASDLPPLYLGEPLIPSTNPIPSSNIQDSPPRLRRQRRTHSLRGRRGTHRPRIITQDLDREAKNEYRRNTNCFRRCVGDVCELVCRNRFGLGGKTRKKSKRKRKRKTKKRRKRKTKRRRRKRRKMRKKRR